MSDTTTGLLIRQGRPTDAPFLFNSWLKSFRKAWFSMRIPSDVFFAQQHLVIEDILQRPGTRVFVVTPAGDEDTICGYAVTEAVPGTDGKALIVHYVYVKETFRKLGLGKQLLVSAGVASDTHVVMVSHMTQHAAPIVEKYHMVYNPFVLFRAIPS